MALGAILALVLALHLYRASVVNAKQPSDFRIFYEASQDAREGRDPYQDSPRHLAYVYPPLLFWCVTPLTKLSLVGAVQVWTVLSFVAWLALVASSVRLTGLAGPVPWALIVLPSLLCYRSILRLNLHGQVDLMLWATMAVALVSLTRGRQVLAGVLIGAGVVLKPLPVLFLLVLPFKRQLVATVSAGIALIFFLVLPASTYGPARFVELMQQWRQGRISRDLSDVTLEAESSNQSIQALMVRCLGKREQVPFEPWPEPLGSLEASTINKLYLLCALALLIGMPGALDPRCTSGPRFALEMGFVVCATHLISRRTLEYHLVSLIIPFTAALAVWLAQPAPGSRERRLALGLLVTAGLLNVYSPILVGKLASVTIRIYGPNTFALFALWICLRRTLRRMESADPTLAVGRPAGVC